jgi:predicted acetyltransferase
VEAIAAEPQAEAEIWRFLLDIDWSATLTAALLPPDHPLFFLVAEPRRLRYRAGDGIWLRLVDLETALPGRRYLDDGPLVLEVEDAFCPWNEGRWRLQAGEVARTEAEADLRLDVRELGSLFLGGFTATQLRDAVRIEELKPGAVERADAIFRWPVHPWCPEIF